MNTIRPSLCRWQRRDGSILIIAFWALSFLSFFAVTLGVAARQKMVLAQRLDQRGQLRWIAEAGARKAIALLKKSDVGLGVDFFKEIASQAARLSPVSVGSGEFSLRITDEERKININTASPEVLKKLFTVILGGAESDAEGLASSIVDWRDEDSAPLAQGAENDYYAYLKFPYECKNAPFDFLDELLLVRGMSATIYDKVKNYLTVWGSGIVNVNTANAAVLVVLGLDEALAAKVADYRAGEDGVEGTQDDVYFMNVAAMGPQLNSKAPLDVKELAQLSNLAAGGLAGVASSHFFITSDAQIENKKGHGIVTCVFARGALLEPGDFYDGKIQYWRLTHSL
jgi:general secretion pathway protein K